MPELPEVETVKEGLKKILKPDVRIVSVQFLRKDIRSPLPFKSIDTIIGQKIISIERRAKYIVIELGGAIVISHLGMTGTWRVETSTKKLKTHDHVVLGLSDKRFLIYNDPRRFGVFDIIPKTKFATDKRFRELGPEPLSSDFHFDYLWAKSRKKQVPVKSFLMDQRIVVGVGNIYVCEALFMAGVSPTLPAGKLKAGQIDGLIDAIQKILKQSIESGGSSISDYKGVDEKDGSYQDNHMVYGRKGEPCRKCSHPISVKVISGRSTFWCVKCQKTLQRTSNEPRDSKNNISGKSLPKTSRTQRS